MQTLHQTFSVPFRYDVHFTENIFDTDNRTLAETIWSADDPAPHEVLAVVDDGLLPHFPHLLDEIEGYLNAHEDIVPAHRPVLVPGGEAAKNDPDLVEEIHRAISSAGLCRHSYVLAVGGGSVIDLAGYAAATAHRGIRLIRVPTTVLSQNDSAVGVKNGVNAFGTKNFLGSFAPPFAVINDRAFLRTLEDRDWSAGISEAVKVAMLKDAAFFDTLEEDAGRLAPPIRDQEAMTRLVYRCAKLHLDHIATSGDPFELGSSRPLDFGHWAAHRLEELTDYRLRHGEAVAIGIALDTTYSYLKGLLDEKSWARVIELFQNVGLDLYVPELENYLDKPDHPQNLFRGLEAFREHLGGELTIMLVEGIGRGLEVHQVDRSVYREAIAVLRSERRSAQEGSFTTSQTANDAA